ncbi:MULTISPECIES: hypothetical protein [Cellulophaga]|uniref:Type VI secretion system baseplate subunit TssK n=1 Tax=Cellulophaga geojensis KL-A TaxID=1328323 RepID=A0ABP3B2M1_9FLAO|nr:MULTISPECIES: hypothetical protein [Cellulophaga]APU09420.1 hypothetical protein A5M85_03720 [Cellulophaga lytica]EWH10549.1 hypothetical protein KLA_16637 [Cellulophaga geojensis KL-A]SNQ42379.1 conserved hypothetical protein [Cellulophaga lytica]
MKTNKIQNLPINWTDGVKLSENHFFKQYYNTIETIKSYNTTNQKNFDYGILEAIDSNLRALDLELSSDTGNTIAISLKSCNAITKNGYKIVFYDGLYGDDYTPKKIINFSETEDSEARTYYVIASISPFELVPVGQPDPEVIPLHHPNAMPKISLDVIPVNQVNTHFLEGNFIVVGKINAEQGVFSLNESYIPPVKKIIYNDALDKFRVDLIQVLIRMRKNAILIIKKNRNNKRTNKLAENTFVLCNDFNQFYGQSIYYLKEIVAEESPIYLAKQISVLANQFSTSLSIMDEKEREELLQYYFEWTDVKPSNFNSKIEDVLNNNYSHINIAGTVDVLGEFVSIIDRLFNKMSALEYIGQRKDNIVISEDSIIKKDKPGKSSWSIFD